jgi:hypothetical protein
VICGRMQPGYMGVTGISILGWIDNIWSFAFPHPCNCFTGLKFPKLVIHGALCANTICNLCTMEVHLEINYQFIDFSIKSF